MPGESIRCFHCGYVFTTEDLAALEAIPLATGEYCCQDRDCLIAALGNANARVTLLESLLVEAAGIHIQPEPEGKK